MNLQQTPFGYEIRTPHLTMLFGGVESQLPNLKAAYPHFDFTRVKQIHSDAVVESKDTSLDYQVIADSHYTRSKNLALCVITADCVPAFLYHQPTGLIAGVHAGWRGVANKILMKTIDSLISQGAKAQELDVVIGPHIQKKSFEVGNDVRDQILTSLGTLTEAQRSLFVEKISDQKCLLDLNQVVKAQLQSKGIEAERVFDLHIDTFSNQDFHSHRRDKEKAGRQISFICQNP
ncbi:peptidoglycan editing factor PgeF [Bdellovibrio svalbardensis]|uniref:Purine nucleoside phosphorylase n=1 Tax=Bdellovibrio svalbardensis TaxID=2972972 RepID=A0ABT6DDW8_9BACT|nr:peptidoglycan editing factor PgeF [Bdellovibrio svalbardensis]MDG0815036.1 peptidoglycan editing factor PgeF [Bdellovibrio svalbardensis]